MTPAEKDEFLAKTKIVEKYKRFAPLLRNAVGANLPDQALLATIVYQLEVMNKNIELLIANNKPVPTIIEVKTEEVVKTPKISK